MGAMGSNTVLYDAMQFDYVAVSTNFTMIARITSLGYTSGDSTANVRAGLMMRNDLNDQSRFYGIALRAVPRVQWEQRLADSGQLSTSKMGDPSAIPVSTDSTTAVWLKLVRSGQAISVYYGTGSVQPTTWTATKSQDFSTASGAQTFGTTVYAGLYGVSGNTTHTSVAVFDNVSITAN